MIERRPKVLSNLKEILLNPFYDNYFCNVTDMPLDKVTHLLLNILGVG